MDPIPFIAPFVVEKAEVSDFVSELQMDGDGGGGLELNAVLLGMIKSSVGEGMRSWLKKYPLLVPLLEVENGLVNAL
jgi:hypothetical protein